MEATTSQPAPVPSASVALAAALGKTLRDVKLNLNVLSGYHLFSQADQGLIGTEPDPYVIVKMPSGSVLLTTPKKENTNAPHWDSHNEVHNFLVPLFAGDLIFDVMDSDIDRDDALGQAKLPFHALRDLKEDSTVTWALVIEPPLNGPEQSSKLKHLFKDKGPLALRHAPIADTKDVATMKKLDMGLGILVVKVHVTQSRPHEAPVLPPPPPISRQEQDAAAARKKIADAAIRKLLRLPDTDPHPVPTVGIHFSGGGWRAMTSGVAFLDELQTRGLLDCVSYVSGLSGGSWLLYNWLAGRDRNVFHDTTPDPWKANGRISNRTHQYSGLFEMRSRTTVVGAIGRPSIISSIAPSTVVPNVLVSPFEPMVEKWSEFLARDLLYWLPKEKRFTTLLSEFAHDTSLMTGQKPVMIFAAIADTLSNSTAQFDWVEFTPWSTRRLGPHPVYSESHTLFGSINNPLNNLKVEDKLFLHHMMGICGSAFAFDYKQAPAVLQEALVKLGWDPANPKAIIPATTTPVGFEHNGKAELGVLRDGGISFNLPFPILFERNSGRKVDVVIIHDASFSASGAAELQAACEQGFFTMDDTTDFNINDSHVKIFRPTDPGLPILVYFLGYTEESSYNAYAEAEDIREACSKVRRWTAAGLPDAFKTACQEGRSKLRRAAAAAST